MLLKVILKPVKVLITCKILSPYLKENLLRFFILPEVAITWSIFEVRAHILDLFLFLCALQIVLSNLGCMTNLIYSIFLVPPPNLVFLFYIKKNEYIPVLRHKDYFR